MITGYLVSTSLVFRSVYILQLDDQIAVLVIYTLLLLPLTAQHVLRYYSYY